MIFVFELAAVLRFILLSNHIGVLEDPNFFSLFLYQKRIHGTGINVPTTIHKHQLFIYLHPGIPTTIKTMGVNVTTIDYLRAFIIEIGSTIILMVVEAQGTYMNPMGWEKNNTNGPTDSRVTFVLGSGVHAEIWPGPADLEMADLRKSYTPWN